jgi:hypothetical protein
MARYTGPPMDLANMRSLGVTKIDVYSGCGHNATVDVSNLPGDLAVPDVRLRLRCSKCGARSEWTARDIERMIRENHRFNSLPILNFPV